MENGRTWAGSPRRGFRWALIAAVALTVVAAAAGVAVASRSGDPHHAYGGPARGDASSSRIDARVTLAGGAAITIPRSFLGISSEYWTIPIWARQTVLLNRVFSMLSTDGPVRLRIGGDSADRAVWSPKRELPEWAFELTPSWLRDATRIVRQTGTQVILDLNTMSSTPRLAARWATMAMAGLPRGSVRAFEVGNEPDIYNQSKWQHMTAGRGAPPAPIHITAESYARSFAAYANAVARVAHGVPLLAPALAEPQKNSSWITKLLALPHPKLAGITAHRYPYNACARPSAPTFPSIPRVLSQNATAGMGRTAHKLEHITDPATLPLWLTEINSVTCGGTKGVSNTFATALWAPDALFSLLRAGVDGVNLHVRAAAVNAAFSLGPAGLQARPLLYGLILFARTLGPQPKLVTLRSHLSRPGNVATWAVLVGRATLHVLVIDKSPRAEHVSLRLPATGTADVQRLLAPSATARSGVTLGGRALGADGQWQGVPVRERLAARDGAYAVSLRGMSAALVTVRVRRGALGYW